MGGKETEILCVSINKEIKRYLEEEAKEQNKTLSEYIREIIYDHIIKSGTTTS
jgi:predicted DNA-binding protein